MIYGIDASSGLVVKALDIEPHHQILDLWYIQKQKTKKKRKFKYLKY